MRRLLQTFPLRGDNYEFVPWISCCASGQTDWDKGHPFIWLWRPWMPHFMRHFTVHVCLVLQRFVLNIAVLEMIFRSLTWNGYCDERFVLSCLFCAANLFLVKSAQKAVSRVGMMSASNVTYTPSQGSSFEEGQPVLFVSMHIYRSGAVIVKNFSNRPSECKWYWSPPTYN